MTIADEKSLRKIKSWTEDWNRFVRDALKARLDKEQQDIISSVQYNPMTAVASRQLVVRTSWRPVHLCVSCILLLVGKMGS